MAATLPSVSNLPSRFVAVHTGPLFADRSIWRFDFRPVDPPPLSWPYKQRGRQTPGDSTLLPGVMAGKQCCNRIGYSSNAPTINNKCKSHWCRVGKRGPNVDKKCQIGSASTQLVGANQNFRSTLVVSAQLTRSWIPPEQKTSRIRHMCKTVFGPKLA
jgi:hypothetical protein